MTRKHFISLANAFRSIRPESEFSTTTWADMVKLPQAKQWEASQYNAAFEAWKDAVRTVASICAADNPRFARAVFFTAAGLQS